MNTATQIQTPFNQPLSNRGHYQHWQLASEKSQGKLPVAIVAGVADIHQCITNILMTRKGTDILRPLFGSNYHDYLDAPQDVFIPNAVREVVIALTIWEPRIDVDSVKFIGSAPHLTMQVHWSLKEDIAKIIQSTEVAINV
ncbi:MAG: GPW/gp25 family protein [Gammaproteobacteria bacterium]|nr:GPW/gp25 family protein [Gammaproteobacteria bacterium]